jgi:adenine specific DNA methylase Mod
VKQAELNQETVKEWRFYEALRDLFVGAKVEGESGYINLMRIKSRYFEKGVLPRLQRDIEEALKSFPEFREELFDKLYTFFSRYFSESGSIYFWHTPWSQNIYEKVYTDDRDVMLFWKTHMLYYVKTDRLFRSMDVEVDGHKFFFDVSSLEHKKANEKRELIYEFKSKKKDGTIVFNVIYSEKGRKTKIEDILRELRRNGIKISSDVLERAFRIFEKQSEVDYFINKDAKTFLREQFDLWLYQYVFSGESEWTEKRIRQLQALKSIAYKIIDFISQFEDELVKIWNKPKFVLNSNYVITLDRIAKKDIGLVKRLLKHENFAIQVKEWKQLGIVDDNFREDEIINNDELNERYRYLPIDTKYFKDLEPDILALFDNLDRELDGWLIKSENYQALNTILPKFREKIQTIYIDPPFNKEQDADYFYNVKYKDATWITLLENRLWLAKDLLNEKGSIFVRCDDNGNMYVRLLMDKIFKKQNFQNEIVIKTSGIQKEAKKKFLDATESLFFYAKNKEKCFFKELYEERETEWQPFVHYPGIRAQEKPWRVAFGIKLLPPEGRHWGIKQELIDLYLPKKLVRFRCKNCGYEHYEGEWKGCPKCGMNDFIPEIKNPPKKVDSNWTNIQSYSQDPDFPTRNAEELLKRVFEATSNEGDLVMDFFLGSGTATAVAHKMRRKWIGVEMGEHFWTVVLPRMKKVLAYDDSGISKDKDVKEKYNKNNAGGFFKYYELEQYEDTLRKARYEDSDFFNDPRQDPYNQYVFLRDLKMLYALEADLKQNKVKVDLSKLYDNIDIAETLSNLKGKWIKRIGKNFVEFEDGERVDTSNLDYREIKPLIWW